MSVRTNRKNIAKFDRWAATYDRGRMTRWLTSGQRQALAALQLAPGDSMLDIGCGTGGATIEALRARAGRACGIDLSPRMIAQAIEQAAGLANVEFRVGDAEALPYPAASFDGALCAHSFHHYSDPLRALREIRRVLKAGGRFVVLDSDRGACPWVWAWDRFLRISEPGHIKYYTEAELLHLLAEAGFAQPVTVGRDHGHFRDGKIGWALATIRATKSSSGSRSTLADRETR
jgi:ubiquinone/menaquinone biosynthesis C-methylase UbiE